jgi:hypothetical protein
MLHVSRSLERDGLRAVFLLVSANPSLARPLWLRLDGVGTEGGQDVQRIILAFALATVLSGCQTAAQATEYLLQIEKPSDDLGAAILLGSKYDSVPAERIVFTFAPLGDSVRVVAASMFVTNPGSAFEQITPVNAGEGIDRTQATLQEIKLGYGKIQGTVKPQSKQDCGS